MNNPQDGLRRTLDEAEWAWLKPHSERNALILVSNELDLLQVGQVIANDESHTVQAWVDQKLLTRPTLEQTTSWDAQPNKMFLTVVVQPYVLFQEVLKH